MKRVIITGSPRTQGRSAHVAEMLFEANIDERPEDELFLVPISEIEVGPCIGCGACRELTDVTFRADDGAEYTEPRPRCVFDDDMQTLYDLLDDADEVTIVSPIYFSGAPAPLKCLLDRLQPYFYADTRKAPKRPATLHVLGEGGDPHGFDPLVSEVKSALACAGFRLITVFDWVGKVTPQGEITAEADEIEIAKLDPESAQKQPKQEKQAAQRKQAGQQKQQKQSKQSGQRPKLDLYGNQSKGKKRG